MPWVGPAGYRRHMVCECGVEAWITKDSKRKPMIVSFRSKSEEPFPATDADW
jgi:hypothetical protein